MASRDTKEKPVVKGRVRAKATPKVPLPKKGKIKRYIFTCAQNNTKLFDAGWASLKLVAKHYHAEIVVAKFKYNKAAHNKGRKPGTPSAIDSGEWYDPRIEKYVNDGRLQVAPGLVWCGELNILPTAVRPLSGLEAYTGRASSIVPHVKIAMESVASGKSEATKLLYTTGTITQRNYIQRKEGQKAEFHHCYGGLLVEVNSEGAWWCRQLNADSDGVIYDLNKMFDGSSKLVSAGVHVAAINWGDIHESEMDPKNFAACWGIGGMVEALSPKVQLFHDTLNFKPRNHHDRGNAHLSYRKFVERKESVATEIDRAACFLLDRRTESGSDIVVVDSNHDRALERWLLEADYKSDPVNAVFFLEAQLAKYKSIRDRKEGFHLLEWAVKHVRGVGPTTARFLREDESFIICPKAGGGVECGMHGHLGPNGARGNARAFARMGRKANVGHSHTAGILDGIYTAGTSSLMDLGYNSGPSSWSHSHIVTYPNGKRAIITVWMGKWKA